MSRIYLDNAATSWPKAQCVLDSFNSYLLNNGSSSARGESLYTFQADEALFDLREKIKNILHMTSGFVSFTHNATCAINQVLYSFLSKGDHVLLSNLEHNSVIRCVNELKLDYDFLSSDSSGLVIASRIKEQIKPNTKAIIVQLGNNVVATVQEIDKIKAQIISSGISLIVDASQGLPYVDLNADGIDAVIMAGHKGLMGLTGTAVIAYSSSFTKKINKCLIPGATGSKSNNIIMEKNFPEYFETGTQNVAALVALSSALDFIYHDISSYREKLNIITSYLDEKLRSLNNFKVYNFDKRIPVFSLVHKTKDIAEVSNYLTEEGIQHRVGLHCSPLTHSYFKTNGTIRFSPSIYTKVSDVDTLYNLLKKFD